METEHEKSLWKIAKKRVEFKKHLATYIVINGMFWAVWYFTEGANEKGSFLPWPVWPMLGWGIGIIFNYLDAYVHTKEDAVQKEYDKLKNKN